MGLWATLKHIKRLTDVEEELRLCRSEVKALEREWIEVNDDLTRKLGKIRKAEKAIERAAAASEASASDPSAAETIALSPNDQSSNRFGTKTSVIMRQIAARRGG